MDAGVIFARCSLWNKAYEVLVCQRSVEQLPLPGQLWEVMACFWNSFSFHAASTDLFVYVCFQHFNVFTFNKETVITEIERMWIEMNHSERWITRLADRWRAQQSAITIANCRIFWAAITWTQIAVSGIPETTFIWGSTIYHHCFFDEK